MRRTAAALAVTVLVAATSAVALRRHLDGHWPFQALGRLERRVAIEGGGTVTSVGIEDRGWLSDGYLWSATYEDHAHSTSQVFAHWVGRDGEVVALRDGASVVCLTPDRRWLYVAPPDGVWRRFDLAVPATIADGEGDRHDRLPTRDLRQVIATLGSLSASSIDTSIRSYDPAAHLLTVDLAIAPPRQMVVQLDPATPRVRLVQVVTPVGGRQ